MQYHQPYRDDPNAPPQESGPNIRSQEMRNRRIGGDQPYRDDPNSSSAPVYLESFSPAGGIGNTSYDEMNNGKQKSMSMIQSCAQACCSKRNMLEEEGPNGMFYRDDFNDMSWSCSVGTTDEHGIWLNRADPAGTIMSMMVWVLLGYSALTVTLLAQTGGIPAYLSFIYTILCCMALACHVKTTLTDPGSIPPSAVPTEEQRKAEKLSMCSQCQTFKPPLSHHCRICNR